MLLGVAPGHATSIDLADSPLFSTTEVPGNLILALSVEWPTATAPAYPSTTAYSASSTFLGYFDPAKCYQYQYNSTTPANSYFKPYGTASSHTCSSSSSVSLWSGNYLNWASMQSLDAFRWVLTGGYRSTDSSSSTILTKTYAAMDSSVMPQKTAITSTLAGATPFTASAWTSGATTRLRNLGTRMWITSTNTGSSGTGTAGSATSGATAYQSQNSYSTSNYASPGTTYELYINVLVCDTTVSVESNCVLYGSTYKPEGLMQTYSSKLRYSAFGYLKQDGTTSFQRDGGVMRARMTYIGPTKPVPGSSSITNSAAEWSSSTGIMVTNPDSSDATATISTASSAGWTVSITNSGVMNYLNKFGYSAQAYKSKDPVSELYYAAMRYYRDLGNVSTYTDLSTAASYVTSSLTTGSAVAASWLDGFPMITSWDDPILYTCQKNFILGIGDVNTHRDADLPGSTIKSSLDSSTPTAVSSDSTVNVKTATDMVGQLEGLSNSTTLGALYGDTSSTSCASTSSECDTYFIAGLAYDAHTKDIRSDLSGTQTVNTYWMDVMEGQLYKHKNQYWLAAKYGGFDVPSGFSPYSSSNSASTISSSTWYTSTDTLTIGTTSLTYSTDTSTTTDKRPDNYFSGAQPDIMKTGLTNAFSKISSELTAATSTAFSTVSANVTSGSASYSAAYDPQTWSGDVVGSSVTYDSSGSPTYTSLWDARTLLESKSASGRVIVTCCTSAGAALAFESSTLSAASLISRTYYTSFSAVSGVTTQSAANFVSYLRGDRTQEVVNGGQYRTRTYLLGDIIDSKVNPVGAPSASYYDYYNPGYSTFKQTYSSRKTVVYVGANDGMMHAFDGTATSSSSCSTCGAELWAYIPSFVYGSSSTAATSGLASLGNPSFTHHFLVDQTPQNFDVNFGATYNASSTTADWHTVLIGGLGKGGNGYYAIDVTDPSVMTSETAVAAKVLWEFTDSRMGYSYGAPVVVKTAKYGWVAIFTSGYNNSDGVGYIFIVNVKTGALLETVATSEGSTSSPINLATPTAFIPDYTNFTADALYVGDIQGDIWRLDLTGTSTYSSPTKIAKLTDSSGNSQPVTTRPLIEIDPSSLDRYVLVGTGRLLADSDITSTAIQTFYAIVDGTSTSGAFYTSSTLPSGYSFPITRSSLNANTSLLTGIGSSPSSSMGWYFDLSADSSSGIAERVNVDPTANDGIVAFAANLPNGSVCSPSGTSRLFAVDFADGQTVLEDSSGNLIAASTTLSGVVTDLSIQRVNGTLRLIAGDSTGTVARISASLSTSSGVQQLNWHDVPMQN